MKNPSGELFTPNALVKDKNGIPGFFRGFRKDSDPLIAQFEFPGYLATFPASIATARIRPCSPSEARIENINLRKLDPVTNTLLDLWMVGFDKALGYLPVDVITERCGTTPEELIGMSRRRNLEHIMFRPGECVVDAGALYFYDRPQLEHILRIYNPTLSQNIWPSEPKSFVAKVANDHADPPELFRVVELVFGDWRNRRK